MKRRSIAATALVLALLRGSSIGSAQDMDDLNLQIHGYATQGFIYTANNNWNTLNSSDGSAAWTEAVLNITVTPESKLRVGLQARYFLLGNYGNTISLDWAEADYKVNEHLGFRVGKVKTPTGLLNEIQDIDPSYLWVLLPQSVYPIASRNSVLAHYGGVVYGTVPLGESYGKVEYRAYGGARAADDDDGYLQPLRDAGLNLPNGLAGRVFGGTLRWETPIQGLMTGVNLDSEIFTGSLVAGPYTGTFSTARFNPTYFFAKYERGRGMLAGEYNRIALLSLIQLPGAPSAYTSSDQRAFYVMASYKLAEKLTAGVYYSSSIALRVPVSSARFQKDWAISARYDLNTYFYLKAEQHFVNGTELGYSTSDNAGGLKPSARMTLLKMGVSF